MKKLTAILLSLIMVLSMIPFTAFAYTDKAPEQAEVIEPAQVGSNDYPKSEHPFSNNTVVEWEYVYPGEADLLYVTFSEETDLGEVGVLWVGDCYYGDHFWEKEASGKTVTVSGKTLSIGMVAQIDGEFYGFDVVNIVAHCHTLTKVERVEPTCVSDGNIEYYYCEGCNKKYDTEEAYCEITSDEYIILPKVGGSCGDNMTWSFNNKTGELTISGTGEMWDFEFIYDEGNCHSSSGWGDFYRSEIKSVKVSEGITNIGDYAFYSCFNIESVDLPDSVTKIGLSSFAYCGKLTDFEFPKNLTSISDEGFSGCSSLSSAILPDGLESIGVYAFSGCWGIKKSGFQTASRKLKRIHSVVQVLAIMHSTDAVH